MSRIEKPASEQEISEIVRAAYDENTPLEILGGGTRSGLGHSVDCDTTIDLSKHNGVTLYEPEALTLVAKSGTTLKDVQTLLQENGQRLPFEPMSHQAIFGTIGEPTIGGVVSGNISGPRRIQAGACRDSLIGVRFINGVGDIVKNGGRVMKNVTGLDLVKLLCGSYGSLGVLSEVAFKVLPVCERQLTLAVSGLSVPAAIAVLSRALSSPFEITGAAHLPDYEGSSITLMRIEGFANSVEYRISGLKKRIEANGEIRTIEGEAHEELWASVKDVKPFEGTPDPVWRISTTPENAGHLHSLISKIFPSKFLFDWGGGLIWVLIDGENYQHMSKFRQIIARFGGHATLVRASEEMKESIPVFQPQAPRVATLSELIRNKFDPARILNKGKILGETTRLKN